MDRARREATAAVRTRLSECLAAVWDDRSVELNLSGLADACAACERTVANTCKEMAGSPAITAAE